jgi:hypothetical protein
MMVIGFEQAKPDPCVVREVVHEAEMVVVVHVNDILAHSKDQATMDRFAAELGHKFKLKDMMSEAGYYMGCHIARNRKVYELKLDQDLYVESMVKRFDMTKATKIPVASGVSTLSKADGPWNQEGKEEMIKFSYREAMGALMRTVTQ